MTAINITDIKEHSNVIAACGTKVGDVDHVQGADIGGVLKSMLTLNEAIIDVKEG